MSAAKKSIATNSSVAESISRRKAGAAWPAGFRRFGRGHRFGKAQGVPASLMAAAVLLLSGVLAGVLSGVRAGVHVGELAEGDRRRRDVHRSPRRRCARVARRGRSGNRRREDRGLLCRP